MPALASSHSVPRDAPPGNIRILLVDDHTILRAGLRLLLEAEPDLTVVGEAGSGAEALEQARALQPDVIVLDLGLPGMSGLETLREVRQRVPGIRVLVLSMYTDADIVEHVFVAGGLGFVTKRAAAQEVAEAIRTIFRGGRYLSADLAHLRAGTSRRGRTAGAAGRGAGELSSREREVLRLIASGYATREIAARLSISPKTVETHRRRAMSKLGLSSRPELVRYALQHGIILPESVAPDSLSPER
jgi:two-component system response regulator NreC